ncbi:hypothetical protein ACM0CQ_06890 [Mycobacteroides abscessus subsp. abscessus]|uniref:AMIN-like domain-containing (lipo)protein n=1 Tax=Mycobacteroides abscessus TaxID=36809 RepID=UPI00092C0814|nr:hypothetical protein [Mycobacteroides abscessus]PVB43398.1 hypothetical protein DDJ39_10095 [Mycobacteroides abscessus]SHR83816.1 Uncharacterised protein [Mycobacteroides abscessus subsp. abscessus]SHT40329.1 Uncharacterised protein [Mycobacteroides abscessus subsp. abscessus]SIH71746.1 Uncharacterised protein [Mycobacteroides abscessus subsp. abscessus]SIK58308.1 Uncharacterised protein [Mycobacteroides abscessus subsp. abscessus]
MRGQGGIRNIGVLALTALTASGCAGQTRQLGELVSPVATTTALPQTTTPAPETFRVTACETVSGGGGKNVAPLLRDVRVGKQDDYDRVTFEFGPDPKADPKNKVPLDELVVPKYSVDSPASVSAGPKGDHVVVAGNALLGVLFDGAAAHEADKPIRSYPGPNEIKPKDFPVLAEAKQGADFEGKVRWALGLNKQRCPQVSTLTNPPRLVVDLPH